MGPDARGNSMPAGEAVAPAARRALGLHEELSDGLGSAPADVGRLVCTCGPETLRLLSEHGELVKPRGGSVNFCACCARLAAIENAEMLWLDALEGDAPEVWMVLGTRTATVDMSSFYAGLAEAKRMLRREPVRDADGVVVRSGRKIVRRWPAVEYACCLEYTTGYGERSGGERRPHWNLLLKGIPSADAAEALAVAAPVWCDLVDAEPHAQHATSVYEGGGLVGYLALHFTKESQRPPAEFRGQRFNCSRGYFTGCTRATARRRARNSLAYKRALYAARGSEEVRRIAAVAELTGDAEELVVAAKLADWLARYAVNVAARTSWVLAGPDGEPRGELFKPATGGIVRTAHGHEYRPVALPERAWYDVTPEQRRSKAIADGRAAAEKDGGAVIWVGDVSREPGCEPAGGDVLLGGVPSDRRGRAGPLDLVYCSICPLLPTAGRPAWRELLSASENKPACSSSPARR